MAGDGRLNVHHGLPNLKLGGNPHFPKRLGSLLEPIAHQSEPGPGHILWAQIHRGERRFAEIVKCLATHSNQAEIPWKNHAPPERLLADFQSQRFLREHSRRLVGGILRSEKLFKKLLRAPTILELLRSVHVERGSTFLEDRSAESGNPGDQMTARQSDPAMTQRL